MNFTSLILVFIGISVILIFRKDWKKCVYFLIFMLPFFGFIQHKIYFLTRLAPLIQDITIIIPLYFLFVLHKLKKNDSNLVMPNHLKNCLYFIVLLVGIYTINPFFDQILMVRLNGVNVWIFYFLFFAIGFDIIESELEL